MTSEFGKLRHAVTRVVEGATAALDEDVAVESPQELARVLKAEQYLVRKCRVIMDNNVAVVVPPLYHEIVTARLRVAADRRSLHHAQKQLEHVLHHLDRKYAPTPAGLTVTVGWGLPYFHRFVPGPSIQYLPVDNRASAAAGEPVRAILDAVRFPSDPDDLILEDNDVVVFMRSDSPDHIAEASSALFKGDLDVWEVTSIRRGFIGGGYDGETSIPKRKAMEAGIPGAESIPETAQMFMGFTSSQKAALGGDMIANFESLPGLTDQWPNGYFRYGTTMHLSHLYEDLAAWYGRFSFEERVARSFRPGLEGVAPGTQTVPEGPSQTETVANVVADLRRYGTIGHSAALQGHTRLPVDVTDNYGNFYPQGTAIPNRADFNTLDNPFYWSADPTRDRWSESPSAGLHFAVFAPTSDAFHRGRSAMDGRYADGTTLDIDPRSPLQGMNSVLRTTHRQNFLVPPRAHRAFPLAELL